MALIFIFLIIFTPLISWIVDSFKLSPPYDMIVMRALTGITLYASSVYALSGIFKSKPKFNVGKRQINTWGIISGAALIILMWFTDLSNWIVALFYKQDQVIHIFIWDLNIQYIMIRLVVSISTFIGVYLIKRSTAKKLDSQAKVEEPDYLSYITGGKNEA